MITIKCPKKFNRTVTMLERMKNVTKQNGKLDEYGKLGVEALRNSTPKESGKTANSWGYTIQNDGEHTSIIWTNDNVNDGVNIAIILQYGHGTGTGGYVQGRDYINPAVRGIFDEMAESIWKEVCDS